MKNSFQYLFIKFVSFAAFWIGKIHIPFSRKLITGADYRSLMSVGPQDGDLFVSRTDGELGNIAIPGVFSHVAVVRGKTVYESVATGVHQADIIDFFMNKDVVALIRPIFMKPDEIEAMMEYLHAQLGKPYNYDFKFSEGDSQFYCTELAYKGIVKACPTSPFTLRERLGIPTVSPDDFYNAQKKFIIIWKSQSLK